MRRRPELGDLLAGLSVALVLIPQSLAYAEVAGMPPHRGLYAAALPPIAAALFASSPYLQTGPVAITALLTLGALTQHAPAGSPEYVQLGLLLAFVVGAARVALGLARMGVIAYLMSQPMLMGFVPAAGILIVLTQLPAALGADGGEGGVVRRGVTVLVQPDRWAWEAVLLTLVTLALVLAGPRVHKLFPAVLLAVALGIAVSELADYDAATVGFIPSDLPPISVDLPWSRIGDVIVPGLVIALVGFAEPASIARTYAAADRSAWDANREFVSQGAANVTAAFSGGFPVGGSFSRSALNRLSGARTRASGAITGLAVLAFLPAAAVLEPLPKAVLAAIVIAAVVGLIQLGPLLRLWRHSRPQFALAAATFAATLAFSPHVEWAVVLGVGLAVAIHLWRELRLDLDVAVVKETLHLHPRGVLWFGSSRLLEDALLDQLASHPEARRLVLHLGGLGRIDLSGALALRNVLTIAREAGLEAEVSGVLPSRARTLVRSVLGGESR